MTATRTKTAMTPDTELLGFERPGTASRRSLTHILFYMHGFFLTVTFTVFMPLAMAIMRGRMANAYRLHWMGQAIAVPTAIMGMGIAVVCSKTLISVCVFFLLGASFLHVADRRHSLAISRVPTK